MIKLKGMTWSHPRGYDPMVACSKIWKERTGVQIDWDRRSLQEFESFPVEKLAREYDLIVIDHPHVGQITDEGCLTPLDVEGRENERSALAAASVGRSYQSYEWQGRQWAFPIDAAAQVQAFRPDLIDRAPAQWTEVLELAREGRALMPLRPPHSLMCFYTFAANLGHPCAESGPGPLIAPEAGEETYDVLAELAAAVDPACFDMDPIAVSEKMAAADSRVAVVPLIYGYVNYAMADFRPRRLSFSDIPAVGNTGPIGSAIGGTGIAVSAFCNDRAAAIDFAYWIAGAEVQSGPFPAAGGQPGHAAGWEDEAVNAATGNFYRNTRRTLEAGWLRPRHSGYMEFQQRASDRLNDALRGREAASTLIADLNRMFEESFQS